MVSNIVRDLCREHAPSMRRLIDKLERHEREDVRAIATKLDLLFASPIAKILMHDIQTTKDIRY